MFIRIKQSKNSPRKTVQICESVRQGTSVKQITIQYVGVANNDDELEKLKQLAEAMKLEIEFELKGQLPITPSKLLLKNGSEKKKRGPKPKAAVVGTEGVLLKNLEEIERVTEGIQDIFGKLFDDLGFHRLLRPGQSSVLKEVVLARLAHPSSKRKAVELLARDFGKAIPVQKIYRMMDALYEQRALAQQLVFESTQRLYQKKVDVLFFDVTTLYFESFQPDGLREFGYSKDQKFHMTQVVLALATTKEGLPMGYKLFPGNTAEVKTLLNCLEEWKKVIPIDHVLLVGDRAMFSRNNLQMLESSELKYIIAAPLKKFSAAFKESILDENGYQLHSFNDQLQWVKELALPKETPKKKSIKESPETEVFQEQLKRLIVTYSSSRAKKDLKDRKDILDKIESKLGKKPKTKNLISNKAYTKFTKTNSDSVSLIDEEKVNEDARWDGLHGLITNSDQNPLEILDRYHQLWTIENAFRINKNDLQMRPIYHFSPERIEAHIAICYLAFTLAAQARYRVSLQQEKMSFDRIRSELLRVQASILNDKTTQCKFRLPSAMSVAAKKIYRCFGISRSLSATSLPMQEHS